MAHEHYRAKRKAQALYAHKRKKHIMEILDRRLRSLETMEMMLLKIETSQNDLQVCNNGIQYGRLPGLTFLF